MFRPHYLDSTRHPAGWLLDSLHDRRAQLSLLAGDMQAPRLVQLVRQEPANGTLVLSVPAAYGEALLPHLAGGVMELDLESQAPLHRQGRQERLMFTGVSVKAMALPTGELQLDCRLPDLLEQGRQEGTYLAPLPCLYGMKVAVSLDVYPGEFSIPGRVLSLSADEVAVLLYLDDSLALGDGQTLPAVTLRFPNGECFQMRTRVARLRPFGNQDRAVVWLPLEGLSRDERDKWLMLRRETQRELLHRAGGGAAGEGRSEIFVPRVEPRDGAPTEGESHRQGRQHASRRLGVREVVQQLQRIAMIMQHHQCFPEELLYDSVDTLIYRAHRDREGLLFGLGQLYQEEGWVRQAVQVAGELAAILVARDPEAPGLRDAVAGALLHTLGKPLLIGDALPALSGHLTRAQTERLRSHSRVLLERLEALGWAPARICRDVVAGISERLDGTGYPQGCPGRRLSAEVRLAAVLKALNVMTHERNGRAALTPLEAYRELNARPEAYDREQLMEVIRRRGPYPVGSLAMYTGGFLAWVMEIGAKGVPTRVKVVKNLSFADAFLDTELAAGEIDQIGRLDHVVSPARYGLPRLPV